ncbi:hypothetical protein ACFPIF_09750 [Brevundimonas faecalis]|uniref:hypothetical protein n=1 Tax=Brevundimonas faecalis TaxID=947378 RepID=UPI0036081A26
MTLIRSLWPWTPDFGSRPIEVEGEQTAAVFLNRSEAEVVEAARLLAADLPLAQGTRVGWFMADEVLADDTIGGLLLYVDDGQTRMAQRFLRDQAGALTVHFELLVLESLLQGQRLTRTALRNAAVVYDHLGVARCRAYANFDIGGYAWAKLGTCPENPARVRAELKDRLDQAGDAFTPYEREMLRRLIDAASAQTLMRDLASAVGADDKPLGRPLLIGYSWSASWDLQDVAQRRRVTEALS